MRTDERIFMLE